jgi:hypothetical protein
MKKLLIFSLLLSSFISYGQEVISTATDSVSVVSDSTDSTDSNEALDAIKDVGMPITAEDATTDADTDTDAPTALDALNNAVQDENIESADADDDSDAPENPDVKESIDPAGPALLIGFGLLPGHESFVNDVISIPLRFSVGADNIFKGFGLMALYERASVLAAKEAEAAAIADAAAAKASADNWDSQDAEGSEPNPEGSEYEHPNGSDEEHQYDSSRTLGKAVEAPPPAPTPHVSLNKHIRL